MKKKELKMLGMAESLADYITSNGLENMTLLTIANHLGTSDRMVIHYFSKKENIIEQALMIIVQRMLEEISNLEIKQLSRDDLLQIITSYLLHGDGYKYTKVFITMLTYVQNERQPYKQVAQEMYQIFYQFIKDHLIVNDLDNYEQEVFDLFVYVEGLMIVNIINNKK